MRQSTWLRRAGQGLVVLLVAGAFAGVGGSAQADAPIAQGWWTSTNQSDALPVTPPDLPVAVPPDVPSDGLLVQGGPTEDSPAAYAALVYDLDAGLAPGKLVLSVAPASATTPQTTLKLCALKDASLSSAQGGPMSQAPSYDCAASVTGGPSSDGTTYTFDAGKLGDKSTLAVAVLPTMATDRVVLSKPGSSSLATTTTAAGAAAPPAFDASSPQPAADAGNGVAQPPALQSGSSADSPALPAAADVPGPAVAAPAGQPAAAASPQPAVLPPVALAGSSGGSHNGRTGLFLLAALAVAVVLWSTAGSATTEGTDTHA